MHQLPHAALILALAMASDQRLLQVARESRGFLPQLVVRWCQRQVLWDPRGGVLCWSTRSVRGNLRGATLGLALGIATTLLLEAPATAFLALIVWLLIPLFHLPVHPTFAEVAVCCSLMRSIGALRTAWDAWHTDHGRLDPHTWSLDLVGAFPAGRGIGSELLGRLLILADAADATVGLVCEPRRVDFYLRHGFTRLPDDGGALTRLVRTKASRRQHAVLS